MNNENIDSKKNKDILMAILGISFVVFLVVIAKTGGGSRNMINNNKDNIKQDTNNQIEEEVKENQKSVYDKLEKDYSFTYNININDNISIITGKKYGDKITLTVDGETMTRDYADFLNIRDYFKYFDISNLKRIISTSDIVKEENNIGTYNVDTFNIVDIIDDIDYDPFESNSNNKMTVELEKEYIKEINMFLDNYYKFLNPENTKLEIKITYEY